MTECISVYAPANIDPADSYGLIACELVRHISRMGIHVNPIALGNHKHTGQDSEVSSLTAKPIVPSRGGILLGYPTGYVRYGELADLSPKIALTMFESSRIPESWVPILNEFDAVIVPSQFCYNIFKSSGVTSPVFAVPLGLGSSYVPKSRSLELPFTFLTFLDRGKRKGGLESLYAFREEFGDDPRVKLIMKHRAKMEGRKVFFENENLENLYLDLSEQELALLYQSCHCLVNPNKGEGFGLIPREFAATGGISLTTNWGATAENIDIWGIPIECDLEKADWTDVPRFEGMDLGLWASPKREDIKRKMRYIFNNREQLLDRAYNRSIYLPMLYSWSNFAARVVGIWRKLINGYDFNSETSTQDRVLAG